MLYFSFPTFVWFSALFLCSPVSRLLSSPWVCVFIVCVLPDGEFVLCYSPVHSHSPEPFPVSPCVSLWYVPVFLFLVFYTGLNFGWADLGILGILHYLVFWILCCCFFFVCLFVFQFLMKSSFFVLNPSCLLGVFAFLPNLTKIVWMYHHHLVLLQSF